MRARDNPFRSERVESLAYRAPGFDWARLLARLAAQGGRGAIRGPQGSGKTTLLHELGERLEGAGYTVRRLRPDPDDRSLARRQLRELTTGLGPDVALLLDGADRLGWSQWQALRRGSREAAVLVVTTHRSGRLPTLYRCSTSVELLRELVAELAPVEMLPEARGDDDWASALYARAGGNLRLALRELYDRAVRGIAEEPAEGRSGVAASG